MPKFEFLDHPLDLKIKAYGRNIQELFSNCGLAVMTYMYPRDVEIQNSETKAKIRIKAGDEKELLIDWLSEILSLSNEKDVCYNNFCFNKFNEEELVADIWGRRVKAKESLQSNIPAALELREDKNGYVAIITFCL